MLIIQTLFAIFVMTIRFSDYFTTIIIFLAREQLFFVSFHIIMILLFSVS